MVSGSAHSTVLLVLSSCSWLLVRGQTFSLTGSSYVTCCV